MARVRVVLRRHGNGGPESGTLNLADLELDDEAHEVRRGTHIIELTTTEYRLLRYLLINAGRVLTRSQILDHVWHYDFGGDASVLETYISYLRRKVDRHRPPLIQTVRGVGYVLRVQRQCGPLSGAALRALTQSLRGRLLIGVISLVVLGLLISSAVTYLTMQHFLLQRVDDQLSNGRAEARGVLGGGGPGRGASDQFPIGTVVELLSPNGTRLQDPLRYDFPTSTSTALPVIPRPLPAGTEKAPAMVTLAGTGGVSHYRAAIWPEDSFHGNYVVLAIPMDDVLSTLNQLLQLE